MIRSKAPRGPDPPQADAADALSSLGKRALGCGRWVRAMNRAVCDRTSAASLALPSVADKVVRGLPPRPPSGFKVKLCRCRGRLGPFICKGEAAEIFRGLLKNSLSTRFSACHSERKRRISRLFVEILRRLRLLRMTTEEFFSIPLETRFD